VALASDGELEPDDVRATVAAIAEATGVSRMSIELAVFRSAVTHPTLLELPPAVAIGITLRLLVDLGILEDLSFWRRSAGGQVECVLQTAPGDPPRRVRAEARSALRGKRSLSLVGRSAVRSAPVTRFLQVVGVVVGHTTGANEDRTAAFLGLTAHALGPVVERELLLERNREREQALTSSAERRLTRLAFDLHDGPIQDVLALAADVRYLQQQLYPFVLESHRELAFGRFEDINARLAELDHTLREVSHSLESKSIVSRPLGEILHREVDAFAARTEIEAKLELRGDPESLDSAQRITVFRAIQEGLANVREHSGATAVEIRVRARRNSIDVRIVDNGAGFEVSRSLGRAAKRGRLGLVGIGERVRMLGGSFEIDSRPGGPTTLSFTLPR
jgi:signal transduction histidine kinase